MPWYSPWSDHIAKSVCKYLLQRYLGQFLEEKLTLDQLTVDLYKGIGVISDVALDVQALNEVAEQQSIPFEFIDGFIEKMSVSVPWSSILSEATDIQVEGLFLTIKKTERKKHGVSMFESMWSSMTSSMQLAEECLKSERDIVSEDGSHTFEGIESFANTIDSILSRIKVKFLRTVIRVEEVIKDSSCGVAFQINVQLMEYFDEAAANTTGEIKQDLHLPAFSTKKIYLEGVTLYSDEFQVPCMSDSKFSFTNEENCKNDENLENSNSDTKNILIGRFAGRQEVAIKFKQEGAEGPKVELQISLGALTVFLSPHQVHTLIRLIYGMTTCIQNPRFDVGNQSFQKPMMDSDFCKIEQELQNLNPASELQSKGLSNQGWANTCLDSSECEFVPLHNSYRLNDSVLSSSCSLNSSVMSVSSRSSHCQANTSFLLSKKKSNSESEPNAMVFHFHVLLSSLSMIFLHDDILSGPEGSVGQSSFEEMQRVANDFFERLGFHTASGYGSKDFQKAREIFSNVCQLNHIRISAAPVIVEGGETASAYTSVIKGKVTASSLEVLECLLEKEEQKLNVEYIELLTFKKCIEENKTGSKSFSLRPNATINFKFAQSNSHADKSRRYVQPKSDFSVELQPFDTEIDITIIDRLSPLLNPVSYLKKKSNFSVFSAGYNSFNSEQFQRVVDSHSFTKAKRDIKINSSFVTFRVRFPVPDLRPLHDMDKCPWWKRSVRKDILYVDVTDFFLHTVVDESETVSKYETQFKDLVGKFKESDSEKPVEFVKTSAVPNSDTLARELGKPRLVIHVYPRANPACLDEHETSTSISKSMNNAGFHSVVTTLESSTKKEHSPFSCKKIIHESDTPHGNTPASEKDGEELIIPGDGTEIADFIDVASVNTRVKVDVTLPAASVFLPSKHFYEVIYNRISSDLLLWEPSAPIQENYLSEVKMDFRQSTDNFAPNFSLCKSAVQCDSDSDAESQDGIFYSVYENNQRHKKKQFLENSNWSGQSKVVFNVTVLQGVCDLHAPVRDSQGNVIPRQRGESHVSFEDGNLFLVAGYKGKCDLDYYCLQVNRFSFYHNGLISDSVALPALRTVGSALPSYLELVVHKTDKCALIDQSTAVGTGSSTSLDMLTVSVRAQKHHLTQGLKMFLVAMGIREATLHHKVYQSQSSWFAQLIDFFDVTDYPIAGYDPCSVLSELHLNLWNCSVDYRPIYLPLRCMLTVGSFNISSNIAAQTSSSTLRFIAEEAAFFISNKTGIKPPDLRRDYICVIELGLFELSLRLSEKNEIIPKIDLRAFANVAHVWTCSDSAKALTELLMYFASDGDLNLNNFAKEDSEKSEAKTEVKSEEQLLIKTGDGRAVHALSSSQVALVNDLMEEAMKESKTSETKGPGKIIYFERGEDETAIEPVDGSSLGVELKAEVNGYDFEDGDDSWEKEFFVVPNEAGMGMMPKKGLPEVRNLTSTPVRLVDNHFSIPLGKADLLRSPKHYPKPVLRYVLREMSLVWHMYGGSDFDHRSLPSKHCRINTDFRSDSKTEGTPNFDTVITFSKNSASISGVDFRCKNWKQKGGPQRRHDILMELQLNKVRFQHEVYPENTTEASRQVLLIQDVELRDRLASSSINKFLYQYSSESKPKQSQTPMVFIKSVLMRSDPKINAQECCLKVSLLPLRLNIDQDSVLFLYKFFSELSGSDKEEEEDCHSSAQTPKHQAPVMTVNVREKSDGAQPEPQPLLIDLDEESGRKTQVCSESRKNRFVPPEKSSQPLFFRSFVFSPEVPVKLDYQGKRVDMSHGSLAGILMGLGQLNNSELKLRKISYRHGLLGFDKLVNFVLSEWANDIKKNQLPSLLGGVGPMHSLVQMIQGIRDLFWLPIEQYQKDGRLVRGFQRGANSFTTSTAMASLELISRLIQIIQTTAETAYDMVSPGPSVRASRRKGKGRTKRYAQPADIREGMAIAYLVLKEGVGETAETIVRVASEEHEQKGVTGAVGGVLRQIPPTVVKPIILATEATNNVIGGMRSQLVPDARKEAVEKWRRQDS